MNLGMGFPLWGRAGAAEWGARAASLFSPVFPQKESKNNVLAAGNKTL
jgi:hypothetical protein